MDEGSKWRSIDLTLAIGAAVIVAYGVLMLGCGKERAAQPRFRQMIIPPQDNAKRT